MALNEVCVACDLWQQMDQSPELLPAQAAALLAGCLAPPVRALRERLMRA